MRRTTVNEAPTTRHGRRAAVSVTAVVGAIALAACGGGGSSKTSSSTSTTTASSTGRGRNNPALAAYRQCLRQHGVTFGGRGFGGGNGGGEGAPNDGSTPPSSRAPLTPQQRQQLQAAQQACQSKLPPQTQQQRQQMQAALNAYRSCMKDHGVTIPDQGNGNGFGGLRGINRNDPTFQAANKVCAPLLPNGGRFFGNGGRDNGGTSSTTGGSQA